MDIIKYFTNIQLQLKDTANYKFCKVSGLANLEEVLEDRRSKRFLAVDESQDGNSSRGGGGGFFEQRFYTVFLLFKVESRDGSREEGMNEVRSIYRKIHARLLKDKKERTDMFFVDENLRFNEIEYIGNDCAGIMFHLTNNEAVNLVYNPDDWNQ